MSEVVPQEKLKSIAEDKQTRTRTRVLFGSGTMAGAIARDLRAIGASYAFTDNDQRKWGTEKEGVPVLPPQEALKLFPRALWMASFIKQDRAEVEAQMKAMGVETIDVWDYLPRHREVPSERVMDELMKLAADAESKRFIVDQYRLRTNSDYQQLPPAPMSELYFPPFITHLDDEHYVDCGAADGDSIAAFLSKWPKYERITAIEPDEANFDKILHNFLPLPRMEMYRVAVSDHAHTSSFRACGDYSSHLAEAGMGTVSVMCETLDRLLTSVSPTYIKMDVEASEPAALWGARRILRVHSPVLAICAYHEASHFWELPLLIHALQPNYRLFFLRYAHSAWELIWFAVPPERCK
jgi:FkbM family methyltransferase